MASSHHFCNLLQNKHQLMLLPFTESLEPMQEIFLEWFGGFG